MTHLQLGMTIAYNKGRDLSWLMILALFSQSHRKCLMSHSLLSLTSHMTGGFNPFWECWTVTTWHHKVWIVVQSILYCGWLVMRLGWLKTLHTWQIDLPSQLRGNWPHSTSHDFSWMLRSPRNFQPLTPSPHHNLQNETLIMIINR